MIVASQGGSATGRLRLGSELRRLREGRRISRSRAAGAIGGSESKISRLELGRLSFKASDVHQLLDLYGVEQRDRAGLLALMTVANTPSWWRQRFNDVAPEWFQQYLDLECAAHQLRTFEGQLVPGLLQTRDYARAVMRCGLQRRTGSAIDKQVELRAGRQQAVIQAGTRLWAVIDEAVLRRLLGNRQVMRGQLTHLLDLADHPSLTIQVMPWRSRHPIVDASAFTILRLGDPEVPDMVYLEYLTGALCLDKPKEVEPYRVLFDELAERGRTPDRSRSLIDLIRDEY